MSRAIMRDLHFLLLVYLHFIYFFQWTSLVVLRRMILLLLLLFVKAYNHTLCLCGTLLISAAHCAIGVDSRQSWLMGVGTIALTSWIYIFYNPNVNIWTFNELYYSFFLHVWSVSERIHLWASPPQRTEWPQRVVSDRCGEQLTSPSIRHLAALTSVGRFAMLFRRKVPRAGRMHKGAGMGYTRPG